MQIPKNETNVFMPKAPILVITDIEWSDVGAIACPLPPHIKAKMMARLPTKVIIPQSEIAAEGDQHSDEYDEAICDYIDNVYGKDADGFAVSGYQVLFPNGSTIDRRFD